MSPWVMPSRRCARTLAALGSVLVVSNLFAAPAATGAGDELFGQQWGLSKINAPAAWSAATGAGIRIGIVDSGIDLSHPDLAGKIVAAAACVDTNGSESQCAEGSPAQDIDGHGSHVAGIAAAQTGNGIGVAGTAPEAQLVVARVFKKNSAGDVTARLEDLQAGIRYVISRGAKVVNLSIGVDDIKLPVVGGGQSPLFDVVQEAWTRGGLPVIASGNSNQDLFGGSANYGQLNAIVVAATGKDDRLAAYSSSVGNAKWAMAAPGGNPANSSDNANMILSTYDGGRYAYLAGTSMATPFVSGVAALLFGQGMARQQVVDTLLNTADRTVSCGAGCKGRLDAAKAVGAAPRPSPGPTSAPPPPAAAAPRPSRTTPRPAAPVSKAAPATAPPTTAVTEPAVESVASPPPTSEAFGTTEPLIVGATPPADRGAATPVQAAAVAALLASSSGVAFTAAAAYRRRSTLTTWP